MYDCCCFCPGWYYYMDCRGDFWVPYEVPADSCCECCWCWDGCCPPEEEDDDDEILSLD